MNDDLKGTAIELAKALIQNSNVKPVFDSRDDISYVLEDTKFSFSDIVSQFVEKLERIQKW